ncbi:hypothetical protein GCM10027347_31150 [Larkinella harenae]
MGRISRLIALAAVLLTALLFIQFNRSAPAPAQDVNQRFLDNVNLALRRTAHHLLKTAGDSTSRIAPVQQPDATTFRIRLNHAFDYSQLPSLLHHSLLLYGIEKPYEVAVLNCTDGSIQLGYTVLDVTKNEEVPCRGREQAKGCFDLQVRFSAPERSTPTTAVWWLLAAGSVLTALVWVTWRRPDQAQNGISLPDTEPNEDETVMMGNSNLNVTHQTLTVGLQTHNLTYREAKLLRFFANHPNQVLERDVILKMVWQDEGVIVGRSVDVFVSRLRKFLQNDPTVRIVAVHGVGYRLEIRSPESV